jgi:RHS repeat-associated protein
VRHADGRITSDEANSFVWNARNQITSMNASLDTFEYDALGRRTSRTVSGATTNYLYDGLNSVQELSGGMPTANSLGGLAVDEHFLRTDSSGPANFLTDPLGSTVALADSAGSVQTSYTYEPFGNTTVSGSVSTNPYQFTGRENEGDGLHYYRARYFSPTFGRFASEDPLWRLNVGANLYAYVRNNPVAGVDPLGLWEAEFGGGKGLGISVKFGKNCGRWNVGVYPGAGEGLFGSYDPTDQGYHTPGFYGGVAGSADVGVGRHHVGVDAEIDTNGSGSSSVTIPIPGGGIAVPLPPGTGPSGSPHGTLGGGAGGALGIEGASFFGGRGPCGCS